jgi:hypothetical protein
MPGNIPADAVVELRVMRENGRKSEPAVWVDHRQKRPSEADVDASSALTQRHQRRVERRAAVTQDPNAPADELPELDRSVRMCVSVRR